LTLADARKKQLRVDWADPINTPVRPKVLGSTVYSNYPIEDVIDYIDWNPFFQVSKGFRCSALLASMCLFLAIWSANTFAYRNAPMCLP
jgi:cobalamin-dependent methionine synthase I